MFGRGMVLQNLMLVKKLIDQTRLCGCKFTTFSTRRNRHNNSNLN